MSKIQKYLIPFLLSANLIEELSSIVLNYLHVEVSFVDYISSGVYIVCFLYLLLDMLSKRRLGIYFVVLFVINFLLLLSYLKFSELHNIVLSSFFTFNGCCFTCFYFASNGYLTKDSFLSFTPFFGLALLYLILSIASGRISTSYMEVAYTLLPHFFVSMYLYYISRKKMYIFFLISFFAGILLTACRGPILFSFVFFIVFLFLIVKKRYHFLLFGLLLISVFSFVIMNHSLNVFGLSERNFSNGFFVSVQRGNIFNSCIEAIKNSPFSFKGLYYDRLYLAQMFGGNSNLGFYVYEESFSSLYAHNFFIEIIMDFGIIFGLIAVLIILALTYKYLKKAKNNKNDLFIFAIVFFCGFAPLLVSKSFMFYDWFWIFLGVCISPNTKKI